MKGPSFLEGVLVALTAALGAALAEGVLTLILPRGSALTLVVAGLGLGYLLYLLGRAREPAGRVVMVIGWLMVTGLTWALSPGPWTQVLVQSGLIWLVRGLYHQATPDRRPPGPRSDRHRSGRRALGRQPHRQRVPRGLVPVPGPGPIRRRPGAARGWAYTGGRTRPLRSDTAGGRAGYRPAAAAAARVSAERPLHIHLKRATFRE